MTRTLGESVHGTPEPRRPGRRLRIIVADDDRDTVLTLMMVLREEGHEVWGLYRSKDVVEGIKAFEPDAVILDIGMPDMSGWAAADAIRMTYGEGKKPLLIAITGKYKTGADRVLTEMSGFDHYVMKPYNVSDVLRLLARLQLPSDRA